jgi:outer membrane lipoprotein SlyB
MSHPIAPIALGAVAGAVIGGLIGQALSRAAGHPREAARLSAGLAVTGAILYGISAVVSFTDTAPSFKQ